MAMKSFIVQAPNGKKIDRDKHSSLLCHASSDKALALLSTIRMAWKKLLGINTLAYCAAVLLLRRRGFITLALGACTIKLLQQYFCTIIIS
jgi:hypothetical protein